MAKEAIVALVLAALFLGALAWLVIYSRLQHRSSPESEQQPPEDVPKVGRAKPRQAAVARGVALVAVSLLLLGLRARHEPRPRRAYPVICVAALRSHNGRRQL